MDANYLVEMKHVCRFCHKRFPCGRSLGGHMRSHLITNPSDHVENKVNTSMDPNQMKSCKECGKAFNSSKALSGHMKSHAVEREKEKERQRQRVSDQAEKTSEQQEMDRESDCRPRRANRSKQRYIGATTTSATTTNSSVSEIDQQEQEAVAMCLIMLSRDVGPWGGVNCELSDNNSVFLEPKTVFKWVGESSTSKDLKAEGSVADEFLSPGYQKFLEKMKCSEGPTMPSVGARKRKAKTESFESEKRSKFECTTCNKTFHSYQALGGHRASHKKAKGCSSSKAEETTTEVSVPSHNDQTKASNEGGSKRIQKHECPICFKEFSSGQALGGHKRSHLMPLETKLASVESTTTSSHEVRDFLDLNLPAPVEEETSNGHQQQQLDLVGFKKWWVESTHKHEQLVGLISN